jgi:hypothetical protein
MKLTAEEHPFYQVFDAADRLIPMVKEFDTETFETKLYIPIRGEVPTCVVVGQNILQDDLYDDTSVEPVLATCIIPGAYALDPQGIPVPGRFT